MKLVDIVMCPSCGDEYLIKDVVNSRNKDVINCTCPTDKTAWNERLYFIPDVGNIIDHKLRVVDSDELPKLDEEIRVKNDRS